MVYVFSFAITGIVVSSMKTFPWFICKLQVLPSFEDTRAVRTYLPAKSEQSLVLTDNVRGNTTVEE